MKLSKLFEDHSKIKTEIVRERSLVRLNKIVREDQLFEALSGGEENRKSALGQYARKFDRDVPTRFSFLRSSSMA